MPPNRPRFAAALAAALPILLFAASSALANGAVKPAWIDGFSGWAGPGGGYLYARVHTGVPTAKPKPGESTYERLKQTVEALELDALKGGQVSLIGVPGTTTATADDHGFLKIHLPAGMKTGLHQVTLKVASAGYGGRPTTVNVQVFADGGVGVISDIDDTLTDTGVTHKLKLLANTLFHSQWELKTFPGAAAAVVAVAGKHGGFPTRPTFYLSGSPWALHSRISDRFDMDGFPKGVMVLRRYSTEPLDAYKYKYPHLVEIFAAFPKTKWVLLGDTGEKDPEVYAQMRKEHPASIQAIYIHNVTKEAATSARFAGMKLFNQWPEAQADFQAKGLAVPAAVNAKAAAH